MSDTNNENVDSLNGTAPAGETHEEKAARLEEANKKLFERAKKAEGFTKQADGTWVKAPKEEPKVAPIINQQEIPKASDILKADEFKLYRAGYSESEIDLIMRNGGMKILEDKKSPLVLGLEAARQQRGAEDAASRAIDGSGLSEIERQYTPEQLKAMSKEELAKILPHTNN